MADFTQNISNAVRCFGQGPSTKWGQALGAPNTMTWGTSTWGEGLAIPFQVVKYVANSQVMTWEKTSLDVGKALAIGSAAFGFDMYSQTLKNGDWFYVFTSDTTAGEERDFASWSEVSVTDATFTCQAAAGTSWSEV